jgi:hypothetical protein
MLLTGSAALGRALRAALRGSPRFMATFHIIGIDPIALEIVVIFETGQPPPEFIMIGGA